MRIQLNPTPEQAKVLDETMAQFTRAFNQVCAYGWQNQEKNGVRLHHETYRDTKVSCPGLVSDLLIQARVKATEALTSAFTWKKKHEAAYAKKVEKAEKKGYPVPQFKPVKCPTSELCPPKYNVHTYTLDWKGQSARLSTTSGKMSIPFTVPDFSAKYQGNKISTADLIYRNGKYWLHVVASVPEPDIPQNDEVIGVDLGLNHPAVTSTRQFLGNSQWKEIDRKHFRLKRKLQSKGTKSAKRHLKKLSKKQTQFHGIVIMSSPRELFKIPRMAQQSFWKTSKTSERIARLGAANKTRMSRQNVGCMLGHLLSSITSSRTRRKSVVSKWSKLTQGIPARRVVNAIINIAPIANLKVCSSVKTVGTV